MISGIRSSQSRSPGAPGSRGPLVACILVGTLILLLASGGDAVRELLRLEREGLQAGQAWRLFGGHLVHLGWIHAFLNLTAFVLIVIGFWREFSAPQWLSIGLASALAIDAGFLLTDPPVEWYVGLSGVLHGLVAAGAIGLYSSGRRIAAVTVICAVSAKLAWEAIFGAMPHSVELVGGPVVVEAHLFGALGGVVAALVLLRLRAAPV
jgi:rhomboid family GlyGly-CTERM serine protease